MKGAHFYATLRSNSLIKWNNNANVIYVLHTYTDAMQAYHTHRSVCSFTHLELKNCSTFIKFQNGFSVSALGTFLCVCVFVRLCVRVYAI